MRSQADYRALRSQLLAIENSQGPQCYLADECVDSENVVIDEGRDGYWEAMCSALISAANDRAEDQGIDLKAMGFNQSY